MNTRHVSKHRVRQINQQQRTQSDTKNESPERKKPQNPINTFSSSQFYHQIENCWLQMSLYIGNLSARTRRDDIERVFRRFGQCNVRLKDGYGFIVYDYPPNAEGALRALQGRNICGEPLTLTWSKKQPNPHKSFARTARSYGSQRSRNSVRGRGYANGRLGTNGRQNYKMGIKQPDSNGGRLNSADLLDEDASNHEDSIKDFMGEEHHHCRENFPDEGCDVEPNPVDNGRWGDQFHDPSNDNGIESGVEIHLYEPYQGHDRIDGNENHRIAYPGGSPASQNSQERKGREDVREVTLNHPNDLKPQQACYNCGGMGHKMLNCPKLKASRKLNRFDRRHADDVKRRGRCEGRLERLGSRSWGKLPSNRDTISLRRVRNDRKASGSGKHQMLTRSGSSLVAKETDRALRKDYGGEKWRRRDTGTPQRHSAKKARRSVSSTLHSDYTVSRLRSTSRSSKPVLRSCSHSRSSSVSSRARSSSSNTRTKGSNSRSRSSSPTSLSLSVSLSRPLPSSPNKVQMNQKGSLDNANTPESKDIPVEQRQPVEGDVILENVKLDNTMVAVNNKNAVSSFRVEDEMENQMASRSLYEVTNPSTALSERGVLTDGSLSPETLRETKEHQNFDESMMEHMPLPIKKPDSEAPVSSHSCRSTSIFSEEMYMVLKHYGLDLPDENQRHIPAEAYFGSARLWPWEIIYYRRLKKGPISTDNYARRLAQNREFGIVDNYIRSSSGWEELGLDNH